MSSHSEQNDAGGSRTKVEHNPFSVLGLLMRESDRISPHRRCGKNPQAPNLNESSRSVLRSFTRIRARRVRWRNFSLSAKFPIARRSKIRCCGPQRAPLSFKALQRAEGEAQSSRNGGDQSAFFPPRFRAMHDDRGALCLQSASFAAGRSAVSPPLRDHGAQHRRW